jgi:predicted phosphodiesterase
MPAVAALYDIHGNLPALEAVLRDVRSASVARIVIGGDVLPGPMPVECLMALRSLDLPVDYIMGNGDRMVIEAMSGKPPTSLPPAAQRVIRWNAQQLGPVHQRDVSQWTPIVQRRTDAGDVLFCHATPRNDTEIFTRNTPDNVVSGAFAGVVADVAVCGHTHMQFDRMVGTLRVVNAGASGCRTERRARIGC